MFEAKQFTTNAAQWNMMPEGKSSTKSFSACREQPRAARNGFDGFSIDLIRNPALN